jgi:hypothetical protein
MVGMGIVERVAARFLAETKIPVINKEKDRIVYVLPETAEEETGTYERVPADSEDHIKHHGKPRRPDRPQKPKLPHKPDIPRATTPAPMHPPKHPKPVLPVPPVPVDYVHPVRPVKDPSPVDEPRRWKLKRNPKPLQ